MLYIVMFSFDEPTLSVDSSNLHLFMLKSNFSLPLYELHRNGKEYRTNANDLQKQ